MTTFKEPSTNRNWRAFRQLVMVRQCSTYKGLLMDVITYIEDQNPKLLERNDNSIPRMF